MADVAATRENKLTLRSSDSEEFVVEEAVAMESRTIKHMVEDDCANNIIPVPNFCAEILAMVINYCKQHVHKRKVDATDPTAKASETNLKTFDEEFIDVGQHIPFDLIMAANYLDIKGLLDLTCQKGADIIKGMTPEEVRKTFNIKNDFTKEEEREIRRKNTWAFK